MNPVLDGAHEIRRALAGLGVDIYEPLVDHPEVVYDKTELESLLQHELIGRVFDAPIKTRGKLAKQAVADALGYPVPSIFRSVRPRFPGQDLDVYVQQSNNLQVWNEDISPTRRYVVLRVDASARVTAVRVADGVELASLDRTGTLTSKYQAKRQVGRNGSSLVSSSDTLRFVTELAPVEHLPKAVLRTLSPTDPPVRGRILGIAALHRSLLDMVGLELAYSASERHRGDALHEATCEMLGLGSYADTGKFPDIACQALEVKLQTAGTIDLGLVDPDSSDPALTLSPALQHRDARYFVAYATRNGDALRIEHIVVSTGEDFFNEFRRFGGLEQNRKLQLKIPNGFFQTE